MPVVNGELSELDRLGIPLLSIHKTPKRLVHTDSWPTRVEAGIDCSAA